MLKPVVRALSAGLIVLAGSVTLAAESDWALVAPNDRRLPPICAKSRSSCEAAARAVRDGVLGWEPVYTACVPRPECFSRASETIRGYNDR